MRDAAESACEDLRQAAWEAVQAGRLRQGLELLDRALDVARGQGRQEQVDRVVCNRAAVLVEVGEAEEVKQDLRRILLASADAEITFLAAYTLARAYDVENDAQKALFYARIAHRKAAANGAVELLAPSYNQLGLLLLARSEFEAALEEFRHSLEILPDGVSLRRATALDNLGYCLVIGGRYRKGFSALIQSVRMARSLGARSQEASSRLSLAFAHLQVGRYVDANRHARRSLALAEACEDRMTVKYGLFVLGEAEKLGGNPLAARRFFCRLQQEFYPEAPNVADILLLLNVQSLVNIKA